MLMQIVDEKFNELKKKIKSGVTDRDTILPLIIESDVDAIIDDEFIDDEDLKNVFGNIMIYRKAMMRVCAPYKKLYNLCFIESVKTLARMQIYSESADSEAIKEFFERQEDYLQKEVAEHGIGGRDFFITVRDNYRFGDTKIIDDRIVILDMDYEMKCKIRSLKLLLTITDCCKHFKNNSRDLHLIFRFLEGISKITPFTQYRKAVGAGTDYEKAKCKEARQDRLYDFIDVVNILRYTDENNFIDSATDIKKVKVLEQEKIMDIAVDLNSPDLLLMLYENHILPKEIIKKARVLAAEKGYLNLLPMLIAIENA